MAHQHQHHHHQHQHYHHHSHFDCHQAGEEVKVDFVARLSNYPHLLAQLFAALSPKDLRTVPCVSRAWRAALRTDRKANLRRLRSIRRLRRVKNDVGEENWPIDIACAKFKRKAHSMTNPTTTTTNTPRTTRAALGSIQNVSNTVHSHSNTMYPSELVESVVTPSSPKRACRRRRWTQAQIPFQPW